MYLWKGSLLPSLMLTPSLFVFSIGDPKQNVNSFMTPVSDEFLLLFHMVASVLFSMAAPRAAYFKDSDWLLKNFDQSKNGCKSYHGEQNQGYHVKEH